jgi:hypothetical protein
VEALLPPLPIDQVAHNRHIDRRSATRTIHPPPLPVAQSQQIHSPSTIRAASPPPSPVQQAVQHYDITQSNTQAYEDSDDDETALSPSTGSHCFPPRFLPRSCTIIDSPRSDRQPSPPSDHGSENVDRRHSQRVTRLTQQDPPSHPPHATERVKKVILCVPRKRAIN